MSERQSQNLSDVVRLAALSVLAIVVHGFHFGIEDEAIYLPAVKRLLDPELYSHDAAIVSAQTRFTLFGPSMAFLARSTRLPLHWVFFTVYCLVTFLFVFALKQLAQFVFEEKAAQWGAMIAVIPLLTMPVAGTALFLMDQHMHPRNLATVFILLAASANLRGRPLLAGILVAAGFAIHPLVTLFGASLILFLKRQLVLPQVLLMPFILVSGVFAFGPESKAWQAAMATADYYLVTKWHWYEWLGIVGPLVGLIICRTWAARHKLEHLASICLQLFLYGMFFLASALIIALTPRLHRLVPLQPMRHLQFLYIFFFLIVGGVLATHFAAYRKYGFILAVVVCIVMFVAQRMEFPRSPHIEWPGVHSSNAWAEAFSWIRENTPRDAYFALNPRYMELSGVDFHGFRGLAERSMLADDIEDRAVTTMDPSIGELWLRQVSARRTWADLDAGGLKKLKDEFGVDWIVWEKLRKDAPVGLICPYQNQGVAVCRLN